MRFYEKLTNRLGILLPVQSVTKHLAVHTPRKSNHSIKGTEKSESFISPCLQQSVGFPGVSVVKNPPAKQETQKTSVRSLGREDLLEKDMATNSSILA